MEPDLFVRLCFLNVKVSRLLIVQHNSYSDASKPEVCNLRCVITEKFSQVRQET